ncbi:hypothetical protein BDR04DRAFT_1117536 [Suillus decipiens]|nr:hypothetical protein BDR04DRAFT_1117536 [Suillus decipiens]
MYTQDSKGNSPVCQDDIKEPPPLTINFLKISSDEGDNKDGEDIIKDVDSPIHLCKNIFLDIEADQGNDEEDKLFNKIEDGSPSHSRVTLLLAPKHNLAKAIQRIEEIYQTPATRNIPTRMYIFMVNISVWEFLAQHLNNPLTIMSAIPKSLKLFMKKWDHISKEEESAVNVLHLQFPYPTWLRIKWEKYRDSIMYIYDSKQEKMFVTMLIPLKEFPYKMPKGITVLFNPSHLPTRLSSILHDGDVVRYKFKAPCANELGYLFLQKDRDGLLQTDVASWRLSLPHHTRVIRVVEAKLNDIEHVFNVGNEVSIIAGAYAGVQGYILERNNDVFQICQARTQAQAYVYIKICKYYLDHCPVDLTLQGHNPVQSYIDSLLEPQSVKIGNYVEVIVSGLKGKSGIVQWASGGFVWFQDDMEVMRANDHSSVTLPFIHIAAEIVEHTCLPTTLTLTKECSYNVRPGDMVCIACGPKFCTDNLPHSYTKQKTSSIVPNSSGGVHS